MSNLEIERGSGNVFRDFGRSTADADQLKAILAAQIIRLLDARGLAVRAAHELTGIAAADFSRIRQGKLDRFSIERLLTIINRLDQRVEIAVTFPKTPRRRASA
jgi:predicted XRE-type DNA-binding protein